MIKLQQRQALTSHFKSFWSIVNRKVFRKFVKVSFFFLNAFIKALKSHISRKENSFAFKLSTLCKQTLIFLKSAVFFYTDTSLANFLRFKFTTDRCWIFVFSFLRQCFHCTYTNTYINVCNFTFKWAKLFLLLKERFEICLSPKYNCFAVDAFSPSLSAISHL